MQFKQSKQILRRAVPLLAVLAVGLCFTVDAQAADIFDRLQQVTGKMGIVKSFLIYAAFILGICALIWAGSDMIKISKGNNHDNITWMGIMVKFIAGAFLVGITYSSDIMQQTIFGSGNSTSTPNISMVFDSPKKNA